MCSLLFLSADIRTGQSGLQRELMRDNGTAAKETNCANSHIILQIVHNGTSLQQIKHCYTYRMLSKKKVKKN